MKNRSVKVNARATTKQFMQAANELFGLVLPVSVEDARVTMATLRRLHGTLMDAENYLAKWVGEMTDEENGTIPALFKRAERLKEERDLIRALRVCDVILTLVPEDPAALSLKAVVTNALDEEALEGARFLESKGNLGSAIDQATRVIEDNPANVRAIVYRLRIARELASAVLNDPDLAGLRQVERLFKTIGAQVDYDEEADELKERVGLALEEYAASQQLLEEATTWLESSPQTALDHLVLVTSPLLVTDRANLAKEAQARVFRNAINAARTQLQAGYIEEAEATLRLIDRDALYEYETLLGLWEATMQDISAAKQKQKLTEADGLWRERKLDEALAALGAVTSPLLTKQKAALEKLILGQFARDQIGKVRNLLSERLLEEAIQALSTINPKNVEDADFSAFSELAALIGNHQKPLVKVNVGHEDPPPGL